MFDGIELVGWEENNVIYLGENSFL